MKFTKRPVIILAEQYTGNYSPDDKLPFSDSEHPPKYEWAPDAERRDGTGMWKVKTAEGRVWLRKGAWLLRTERNPRYFLRGDEDFRADYEAIDA